MSQTHDTEHTGEFVASRVTDSRNPQEVADMLAIECGNYPDRILLVRNGEHLDKRCYDTCPPEVVEDWTHDVDFSIAV